MDSNCTVTPKPKSVKEFFKSWYFWKPFLALSSGDQEDFCTTILSDAHQEPVL